jgi:transcriptional regulator with XRE-family HTH domain
VIGDRVKAGREQRQWSQYDLARESGVSQSAIAKIETGQRPRPSGNVLQKLARALDTTVDALLQDGPPIDIDQPPIDWQKAAGEWSESNEAELRRAWAGMTLKQRAHELAELQRLAALRAEIQHRREERGRKPPPQSDPNNIAAGI